MSEYRKGFADGEVAALIEETVITLRHARTFITSREKMHPDGVELYDRLLARLSALQVKEPADAEVMRAMDFALGEGVTQAVDYGFMKRLLIAAKTSEPPFVSPISD